MKNLEKFPRSRPEPRLVENILDEQEDKVKHYFKLYSLEKKNKMKLEQYNYWLQQELKTFQNERTELEKYIDKLEGKFAMIKSGPNNLLDQIQRLDLIYLQLDTLVQSLAGICNKIIFDQPNKEESVQIILDYLFPCRALDSRLNTLHGLIYYNKIGEKGLKPDTPPVPPTPLNKLPDDSSSPWISSKLSEQANLPSTGPTIPSQFEKNLEKPIYPNKTEDTSKSYIKQKETSLKPTDTDSKRSSVTDSKSTSLRGFELAVHTVDQFKRPYKSKTKELCCVLRYDHEKAEEVFSESLRKTKSYQSKTILGKERVEFNESIKIDTLPPKVSGVIPKFLVDLYDGDSIPSVKVGSVSISFDDSKYLKSKQEWDIKDDISKAKIGSLILTFKPIPESARMPAQVISEKEKRTAVAPAEPSKSSAKVEPQKEKEPEKEIEAKSQVVIKKPLLFKKQVEIKKQENSVPKADIKPASEEPKSLSSSTPKISEKTPEGIENGKAMSKPPEETSVSNVSMSTDVVPKSVVTPDEADQKAKGPDSTIEPVAKKLGPVAKKLEPVVKTPVLVAKEVEPSKDAEPVAKTQDEVAKAKKFSPSVPKKGPLTQKVPPKQLDEAKVGGEMQKPKEAPKEVPSDASKATIMSAPVPKKVGLGMPGSPKKETNSAPIPKEPTTGELPKLKAKAPVVSILEGTPQLNSPPPIIKKPVLPQIKKPELSKKILIKKQLLLPKLNDS